MPEQSINDRANQYNTMQQEAESETAGGDEEGVERRGAKTSTEEARASARV